MAFVETTIFVQGPPRDVYLLARDMENFPQYMPDVDSVKIVERGPDRTVTEWVTSVEGIPICWTEEDIFDDDEKKISYKLVKGDLDKFDGEWTFTAKDGGTEVVLTVDFDFGMPTLVDLLGPILEVKVRENSEMMLNGIKAQIEE